MNADVPRAIASISCYCYMYWLKALGYFCPEIFPVVYLEMELAPLMSLGDEVG